MLCWITAFLAISGNTVEAFADPSGGGWEVFRFGASALFTIALVGAIVSRLVDRRAGTPER